MILELLSALALTAVGSAQLTGITCSAVTPIDVPRDVSLYWGTWFTIGTCSSCTNSSNICSQVIYEPIDATNMNTNVTYIGSYQVNQPYGTVQMAYGNMIPQELETFDPVYRLDLDLGFAIIPNDFWILATAGDGNGITALATYSCGTDGTNAQVFYLSRQPYLIDPVTFSSLESKVKRSITNYDEFKIVSVTQQQGWCNYQYTSDYVEPVATPSSLSCSDDDNTDSINTAVAGSVLSAIFSGITAGILIVACFRSKVTSGGMDKNLL